MSCAFVGPSRTARCGDEQGVAEAAGRVPRESGGEPQRGGALRAGGARARAWEVRRCARLALLRKLQAHKTNASRPARETPPGGRTRGAG
eukprot:SAG31_NODE_8242_length_1491_cov_1.010776_1_plen_89_part_10